VIKTSVVNEIYLWKNRKAIRKKKKKAKEKRKRKTTMHIFCFVSLYVANEYTHNHC
jgi:hypothetical protein